MAGGGDIAGLVGRRGRESGAAGLQLTLLAVRLGGAIEEAAGELEAGEEPEAGEVAQGVGAADVQEGVEFLGEAAGGGPGDEGAGGGAEGAVGGEADAADEPQSVLVKAGGLAEGVVAPGMGVAGEERQFGELANDGAARGVAEGGGKFRHGGDGAVPQEVSERVGGVENGAHEGSITAGRVTET